MTTISVLCIHCHQRYNAPASLAGKRVKCKHCAKVFQIPAEPTAESGTSRESGAQGQDAEQTPSHVPTGFRGANVKPPTSETTPGRSKSGGKLGHASAGYAARMARNDDAEEIGVADAAAPIVMLRPTIPFDFPGAPLIDQWLPILMALGGLFLLSWMAVSTNLTGVSWVTTTRVVTYLLLCLAVTFPAGYVAVRAAARKCRFMMPPMSPLRALGSFTLAFAIAFAFWLSGQSLSMLIVGGVMGLVLASGAIWFLFRVQPREMGTVLGASGAAYVAAMVVSYLILLGLNVIFVHSAQSSGSNQLTVSPVGPTFAWDVPVVTPAKPKHHAIAATTSESVPATTNSTATTPLRPEKAIPTPPTPATATDPPIKVDASHQAETPAHSDTVSQGESTAGQKTNPPQTTPPAARQTKPAVKPAPIVLPNEVAKIEPVIDLGDYNSVLFPSGTGNIVVASKKDQTQESFAFYGGNPLSLKGQTRFEIEKEVNPKCCLSPNGEMLARLTLFPKLSVILWDTLSNKEHKVVALNPDHGKPELLGFGFNDTLVVLWDNGGFTDVEVINTKGAAPVTVAAIRMRAFDRSACNPTISPDGRQLAVATFVEKKGGIDLWDLTTSRKGELRTCFVPLGTWVTPSSITYAPVTGHLATFFELGGKGVIYSFRTGDGGLLHEFPYRTLPFPAGATEGFTGRMLDYMNGNDWLLAGQTVIDIETGKVLSELPVENVKAQRVIDKETVLLFTQTPEGKNQLVEVRFKTDQLAARRAEARGVKAPPR